MKLINDEMLNKYIDGDLSDKERQLVILELNSSPEIKKKYEALKLAHQSLKTMETESPKSDIKNLVMARIKKNSANAKRQKYFLFSILSFFGIIIFGIIGFVAYHAVISSSADFESVKSIKYVGNNIADFITSIMNKKNISIIGSILSLIILSSVYYLFENKKKAGSQLLV